MSASPGGPTRSACTLARHRQEAEALLAPVLTRIAGRPGIELAIDHPDLPGRVLAKDHRARSPIPAFDNSQMDGYAVRAEDLAAATADAPRVLPIGRATAAGDPRGTHVPGTASPVMTGAPVPEGADAIVPIEASDPPEFPALVRAGDAEPTGSAGFLAPVLAGRFIRRSGEDLSEGALVGAAGSRLTPALIGALAAAGLRRASVRSRPRILLCSTGNELSGPGARPRAETVPDSGLIHDANTPMLSAELRRLGADVIALHSGDDVAEFRSSLESAISEARSGDDTAIDLIVTTGGISRGAFEVVKDALRAPSEIADVDFHSVALQPGGPQGLGRLASGHPILCFPGNPVSALLSCELFLAPTLRLIQGLPAERETLRLPLGGDVESPPEKHQLRRAQLRGDGSVAVLAPGSHMVGELAAADLLVHLPIGISHARAGTLVDAWRFND